MRRKYRIAGTLAFLIILVICAVWIYREQENPNAYQEKYVAMKELPGLMSFTYYEEKEWQEIISEMNGEKKLKGKLTYGKLERLLKKLSVETYVSYEKKAGFCIVSRTEWNEIYEQILDLLDVEETVTQEDMLFLEKGKEDKPVLTQEGYLEAAEGAISYFNQYDAYRVYRKGNHIIGVKEVSEKEITWKNVFVHKAEQEKVEAIYENRKISFAVPGLKENIQDTICDIVWKDKKVTAVYKKEEMILGKVLSFNENQIEISGYGTLEYDGEMRIYKTYGTVEQLDESKLVIGNLQADFVVAEKKVCGIILKQPAEIKTIRVLLLKDGGPYREKPAFVSDRDCTLTIGKKQETIEAGQVISVDGMLPEKSGDYIQIVPAEKQGKIYFSDEAGNRLSAGYRGTMEVRRYPQGFGVVNEVSLEQYLYGVVPSEMPVSYEMEALRAQAVCARSYACIQLMKGDYASFAANVDDSTNYQVYNKQQENEKTNLAVDDTVGEVIKYNREITEAYYFSTSCGHTGDMTAWNLPMEEKYGYLRGTTLLSDGSEPDFSTEEKFAEFIKKKEIEAFDSDAPYFRWRAEVDAAGKRESINQAITERIQASPSNIQMTKADKTAAAVGELAGFGSITEIKVLERGVGGCVKKLLISYERGSVQIMSEYNIRYVLGKAVSRLTDKNDKEVEMTMLPSAYLTVIPTETKYVIYGGGYGHGIGMSQNGANGMAKTGMTYIDILQKYYKDITIENIYNGA